MAKGLSWNVWKQSAKDAAKALYEAELRRVGIQEPEVITIHKDGDATVAATAVTLKKIETIPGVVLLSGVTGEGVVRLFIPAVDSWLEEMAERGETPFYTDEERAALKGSKNPETAAEKAAREKRAADAAAVKSKFAARFGKFMVKPSDEDGNGQDAE